MTIVSLEQKKNQVKQLWKTDPESAKRLQKQLKKQIAKRNAAMGGKSHISVAAQQHKLGLLPRDDDDFTGRGHGQVEFVAPSIDATLDEAEDEMSVDAIDAFRDVMERFKELEHVEPLNEDGLDDDQALSLKQRMMEGDTTGGGGKDDMYDVDEDTKPSMTLKQMRKVTRPSVAQLKQSTTRPDLVEVWDTTSPDPYLVVFLKAYRNTVPTPPHWSHKRRYMQGKRGIEKPPFRLPSHIEATKISEIRQSLQEKEANKTLKQKQRDKMRPKQNKMHIDYQVLHDAFFKYATKPTLTRFGDVYYEGKEFEVKMRQFKPGVLSERLKDALGVSGSSPPPWLINMQRYGPPPNYPSLRIPGLSAPVPSGGEYGYHSGGWGKVPLDDFGAPIHGGGVYGDGGDDMSAVPVDNTLWGEIPEDESEEEEEEDEEMEEGGEGEGEDKSGEGEEGKQTPLSVAGTSTPFLGGIASVSGVTSLTSGGLDTPLSLGADLKSSTTSTPVRAPYQVLHQAKAPSQPTALFQSTTIYKMPTHGGSITPFAPGGMITPHLGGRGGAVTPSGQSFHPSSGGSQTPYGEGGDIITLNTTEIAEQEGSFAADVIRSQIKQHEEAGRLARQAARQVDLTEAPPSTLVASEVRAVKETGGTESVSNVSGYDSAVTVKGTGSEAGGTESTTTLSGTDGGRSGTAVKSVTAASGGSTGTDKKKTKKKQYKF